MYILSAGIRWGGGIIGVVGLATVIKIIPKRLPKFVYLFTYIIYPPDLAYFHLTSYGGGGGVKFS